MIELNIEPTEENVKNVSPLKLIKENNEDEKEDGNSNKPFVVPSENLSSLESLGGSTFDYLYEFSETRKVLEEFFKCPPPVEEKTNKDVYPFQVSLSKSKIYIIFSFVIKIFNI